MKLSRKTGFVEKNFFVVLKAGIGTETKVPYCRGYQAFYFHSLGFKVLSSQVFAIISLPDRISSGEVNIICSHSLKDYKTLASPSLCQLIKWLINAVSLPSGVVTVQSSPSEQTVLQSSEFVTCYCAHPQLWCIWLFLLIRDFLLGTTLVLHLLKSHQPSLPCSDK